MNILKTLIQKRTKGNAMKRTGIEKMIFTSLTSIAGGAIIGILFAPDKGTNTRKKITKRSNKLFNGMRKRVDDTRTFLKNNVKATEEEISKISENAQKKGEEVIEETKKMTSYEEWTKDELYERAREKKIDGYSQMNKDQLIKALKK